MRGQLAYDWPPAVLEIEERYGWKNNSAWIFCVWWKTPQLRRRARWDSGTGTMPTKWRGKRCAKRWTREGFAETLWSVKAGALGGRGVNLATSTSLDPPPPTPYLLQV